MDERTRREEGRRSRMKVTDFSEEVTKKEGLKKSISIAQIKEVLRIANQMLKGELYKLIRRI